jgi:BMFP domain-containing protein YqiC
MAVKPPPPPWEVLQQVGELIGGNGLKGEVDKSVKALVQSALQKLEFVSREEFDAQAESLKRSRERIAELEAELERLTQAVEGLEQGTT